MSLRRFLYVVGNNFVSRSYSLCRIDTSRFFFRGSTEATPTPLDSGGSGAADPSAIEDGGRLPEPAINFGPPNLQQKTSKIGFVLFKNKEKGGHYNVVAIDNMGHSFICDPDLPPTVRALPSLASSKFAPFSLTVGDSLYVMDAIPGLPSGRKQHTFEVLSNDEDKFKGWYWNPLDPPPHVFGPGDSSTRIESYTVVAGTNILVSGKASAQTYCFDTVNKTWNKAGDWALPFNRLAEYLPEHKLWFGISPIEEGYSFCAANLLESEDTDKMRLPVVHRLWKEYAEPPQDWSLADTYAVHLGSSKFCIVRFFDTGKLYVCPVTHGSYKKEEELQMVLTGVEVESSGGEVRVVKHKSERFKLDADVTYRVL